MARLAPFALCLSLAAGAALAGPLPAAPANPAVIRVADGNFQAEKRRYIEQASEQMAAWRTQIDALDQAERYDADAAWHRAMLEEYQLEGASEDRWKRAKDSFEEASQRLGNILRPHQ